MVQNQTKKCPNGSGITRSPGLVFTYRPPRGLINPVDVLDTQFYTLSSAEMPKFQHLYTFGLKCLAQAHNHKKIHSCSTNTLFS